MSVVAQSAHALEVHGSLANVIRNVLLQICSVFKTTK